MTPDPTAAAPLTAEQIARNRAIARGYLDIWPEIYQMGAHDKNIVQTLKEQFDETAALRDRLARAEARAEALRQALDDARCVLNRTYDSITEYGRYDSDTAAEVIHAVHDITDALGEGLRFATPTDGAARAGDGGEDL